MDSILIIKFDRIYKINWIFYIPGFRMKPGIANPFCGNIDRKGKGTTSVLYYW